MICLVPLGLASMIGVASWCYSETWASAPWAEPEPLQAVQHLSSLLNSATGTETDKHVTYLTNFVQLLSASSMALRKRIKSHCKIKHLVHVEYQKDMNTGRDLVRVWRCVAIDHYTDFSHEPHDCPEGEYYDWQKIEVVNIWIKKTWRTSTWNMFGTFC